MRTPREAATFALALASLLSFLTGCAGLNDRPPREAADGLSVAASEARKDDDQKQRVLATEPPRVEAPSAVEVEVVPVCDDRRTYSDPDAPRRRLLEGWDIGLVAGGSTTSGMMLTPGADVGIRGGYALSRFTRADLGLTYGGRGFAVSSGFAGALDAPYEITADLSMRHAIARDGRPIGIAPMLGVQFTSVGWDYHHPVVADDGSGPRVVHDDLLDAYAPYAGVALTLLDSSRMRIDMVAKAGARFYDRSTWEGFWNDSFRPSGFAQIQFETHFPF